MAKREQSATARMEGARKVRQRALDERVRILALLTAAHPGSHIAPSEREDVSWNYVVCLHLPTGNIVWRLPDEDIEKHFKHLPIADDDWVKHSLDEKLSLMDDAIAQLVSLRQHA